MNLDDACPSPFLYPVMRWGYDTSSRSLSRVKTFVATAMTVLVALTGGCAFGSDSDGADDRPSSSPAEVAVIDSEACEEVRSGIEAFNLGELDETVEHFEKALPLAEERDDGSEDASDLIEAVRYYAELDTEDYPEAARSSADFAKYKAITLGQCSSAELEQTESPGVEV